jgi:hypothetical protein
MRPLRATLGLLAITAALAGCANATDTPKVTAEQVVTQITQHVPTAKPGLVVTAENDPNHLLGRPGGYMSKVAFTDSRVPADQVVGGTPGDVEYGGSVEVFGTEKAAQQRKDYIQGFGTAMPILAEYDYVSGPALLRVSRVLTPAQAGEYQKALGESG